MKLKCAGFNCSILTDDARESSAGDCVCQRSLELIDDRVRLERSRRGQGFTDRRYRQLHKVGHSGGDGGSGGEGPPPRVISGF